MKLKSLHYIFSKKHKWGSRLISWASNKHTPLENAPAHVALLVNEKWVFESTYVKDVSVMGYNTWKSLNIETHKLKCPQKRNFSELKSEFKALKGKKYDWLGICYFTWRFLLLLLLKIDMPKANKWEREDAYFCCEAVGRVVGKEYSMKTPAQIYLELSQEIE